MYFPVGWPKVLNTPKINNKCSIRQLVSNRDKILFVVLTDNSLLIYYCKPCLLIVISSRSDESVNELGANELVEWKPDSSAIVVTTTHGCLLFYKIKVDSGSKGLYELVDPPQANLRRDSAELFVKEVIPPLQIDLEKEVYVGATITGLTCIRDELMVSAKSGQIYRYRWNGTLNLDYSADLGRVPFSTDQHLSRAVPIFEANTYVIQIEYSPLNGGFALVFNDGRAAFLTATCLRFDPNTMVGIWAPGIDDATCAAVNHKFRLITFGRENSQGVVYSVDETTGGLIESHRLTIPGQVFPGPIGAVRCARWSPDSCVLAMAWSTGGIAVWSTFGALLTCTLAWDYGLNVDLTLQNPLNVHCMDWSAEGYQLWMVNRPNNSNSDNKISETNNQSDDMKDRETCEVSDSVIHLNFVKSALTVNPCVSHHNHLYLQGEDKLYVSTGATFTKVFGSSGRSDLGPIDRGSPHKCQTSNVDNKQWTVVQIPSTYSATNWPVRYSSIDLDGVKLAVAGRAGLAHYSLITHRWKLFGNETQEKDMLVTGGLLWWKKYIVAGCYNIQANQDELRLYPSWTRLSNIHMTLEKLSAQCLLLDQLNDRLLVFTADSRITIYLLEEEIFDNTSDSCVTVSQSQLIDLSALGVHPACYVAISLFSLRTEPSRTDAPLLSRDNFIINISGRVLMVNMTDDNGSQTVEAPVGLASCVENVWSPTKFSTAAPHLTEALWLFCGSHGMRVWLPLFPRDPTHTYMSKRIMLPFHLKVYPLAILFEDAVLLGVENDTLLYSSDSSSPFSLPFSVLERSSQVYLHQVLRQLIKRNLGYHAWEIARCCTSLPYFPHSLELLLHEVLEEEATSKEPIPDALLPSVIEFIKEFPVYLDTVVQCARKTEIALWPYLFSVAGKPKDLFQKCLSLGQLETAASYLIILQNLEPSSVSRQYATMLLDSTLQGRHWELSKELVRFLKAIDPNDVEQTRASLSGTGATSKYGIPQTRSVSSNEEDLSLVLGGTAQLCRVRSFSTTVTPTATLQHGSHHQTEKGGLIHRTSMGDMRKKSAASSAGGGTDTYRGNNNRATGAGGSHLSSSGGSAEEFFMDKMVERHARRLLCQHRLRDLGRMAAVMDFPLVSWLVKERNRAAIVDNVIAAVKSIYEGFGLSSAGKSGEITNGNGLVGPTNNNNVCNSSLSYYDHDEDNGVGATLTDSGYMSYRHHHPARPLDDVVSITSDTDSTHFQEDNGDWSLPWAEPPPPPPAHLLESGKKEGGSGNGIITSAKAEIQLRYLLQLLTDAGCLQWALVVAFCLGDGMAVSRITNAARSPDQSFEAVLRLRDDMAALSAWSAGTAAAADIDVGQLKSLVQSGMYRPPAPAAASLPPQVAILDKLLATKQITSLAATSMAPSSNTTDPISTGLPSNPVALASSVNSPHSSFRSEKSINHPISDSDVAVIAQSINHTSSCVIS